MKSVRFFRLIALIFFGLLISPLVAFSQTTLDEIVNDMTLPHEGRPHGVPDSYNWSKNPRAGAVEPPADWTAGIAWGQLYEWINGNPATNTRVQIKYLELHYLSKTDHQWHRIQKTLRVNGNAYVEDFVGDVNKPADTRIESDGSISVTCGDGYNFHFWPSTGRSSFPANVVAGCFVTVKARLVLDDPLGNDDRDSAKYVLSVGGDWWLSLTAAWDNFKTNADMGIGRFRFVTPEWRSYSMFSVPVDTLLNNPPPFTLLSSSVEEFETESINTSLHLQTFPNPASGSMQVCFFLPEAGRTRLTVHDLQGRLVDTIHQGFTEEGPHNIEWQANGLSAGNYLIRLECNQEFTTVLSIVSQ
ncbi:MAG: T9SS type A sorting domain-containing protein [Bacteroidales bacterium]